MGATSPDTPPCNARLNEFAKDAAIEFDCAMLPVPIKQAIAPQTANAPPKNLPIFLFFKPFLT